MPSISAAAAPAQRPAGPGNDSDFLPDLCKPQALLILVLVAQLLALLLASARTGLGKLDWATLAAASFQVQWIMLVSALGLCRLRPRLRRWPALWAGTASYLLILLVTLAFSLFGQLLMLGHPMQGPRLDGWSLATDLLTAAILAGIGLRYLYLQQQLRNQQQAELQARIQALQSRIRPHFLFNSMNSIASLIAVDPATAERAIEDLSSLFRASLAEPALIPLEQELALCKDYVAIEQLRLGDRLTVDWRIEAELPKTVTVPALMLQPLLENAVLHGVEPLPGGGRITVQASRDEQRLVIRISNPLPPRPATGDARSNHLALDNIRHRLNAHYGATAQLSARAENDRFTLVITYPVE